MDSPTSDPGVRYRAPEPHGRHKAFLVLARGTPNECRYGFVDKLEIGRDIDAAGELRPALLLVNDRTVSRSHCVLTFRDGRCVVRDTSRNGTRVDGRRLMPNVEVELHTGQRLSIGETAEFVVVFDERARSGDESSGSTLITPLQTIVTVLVGDIRDYTGLLRRAPAPEVQQSVRRLFNILTSAINTNGGTVKEFQGDAIVAFWDGTSPDQQALAACRTALLLDRLVQRLAQDAAVWTVREFALELDWALATGPVMLDSLGRSQPAGLSMVGEAPVLAFRLEKFATDETGRILACGVTRDLARGSFRFRDLGRLSVKGFDVPDRVFALEAELGV